MSKTELSKTEEKALAALDFEQDAGGGLEGADRDSFAIPFLRVLQKGSPQVEEGQPEYLPDAKPGMLMNSVNGDLFDGKEGITILPCAYERRFVIWAPRGDGGYQGDMTPSEVNAAVEEGRIVQHEGRLYIPLDDGTINEKKCSRVQDTRSHFVLIRTEDGGSSQVVFPLASTQIKKSKQLMSILSAVRVKTAKGMKQPPSWMNKIRVTTVLESNDEGSWYGVRFEREGLETDPEAYAEGKAFHDAVTSGEAKAKYAEQDTVDVPSDDEGKF